MADIVAKHQQQHQDEATAPAAVTSGGAKL
jgi:hypothetical protein